MKNSNFILLFLVSMFIFVFGNTSFAVTNEECLACHNNIEPKVDINVLNKSVHNKLICTSCHIDIQTIPHKKSLKAVNCANCHSNIAREMAESIHHKSNKENKPNCVTCHGSHDVLSASNEKSKTNFFNITSLCTTCHKRCSNNMKQCPQPSSTEKRIDRCTCLHNMSWDTSYLSIK